MPSLDSLPGDQRAVLQLVLSRGRSYDQIAQMLSINRSAVRERALAALSALGPETPVPEENRARIADYLLGQLADQDAIDEVRDLLARSPAERAWARVVASELAPLADNGLPEIPTEAEPSRPAAAARAPAVASAASGAAAEAPPAAAGAGDANEAGDGGSARRPRSSRLGGAIVIAVTVVIVAVVLFFVLRSSGGPKHQAAASAGSTTSGSSSAASTSSTTSSTSSGTQARVVAQINLTPPRSGSKAAGIAEVLNEGTSQGVALVAQNVPPNSTKPPNAYAVWLYNSPKDAQILGFVNPGVGSNGRLSTAGALPSNAKHFKQLIVTVETQAKPKAPGTIILQGALTGL
jgi:hypothetical protein